MSDLVSSPETGDSATARPLSPKEFYGYALGFLGPITLLSLINVLLVNYYMLVLGLDPILAGAGLSIGLVVYSLFALVFGNISDNSTGKLSQKLGKRRPFMLYSIIPMVLTFILMWIPPVKPTVFWEENWGCAIWMWTMTGLFHLAFACFSPPYWALMQEISHSEDERLRLSIVQNLFNLVGTIVSILVPIVFFAGVDTSGTNLSDALFWNLGPDSDGSEIITNMLLLSVLFAAVTALTIIITVKTINEAPPGVKRKQSFGVFLRDISTPLTKDKDHAYYQTANFLFNITMRILMTYVLIFIGDVLGLQGIEWFFFTGIVAVAAVGSFVLWDKLKDKVGLKKSFLICLAVSSIFMFSSALVIIPMARIALLILGTLISALLVIALIGILIFPNPIVSALVDRRKEFVSPEEKSQLAGKYQGINLFIMNISSALANVIYAAAYKWLETVNESLTVLLLPLSAIFLLASVFVFMRVRLDNRTN